MDAKDLRIKELTAALQKSLKLGRTALARLDMMLTAPPGGTRRAKNQKRWDQAYDAFEAFEAEADALIKKAD